MCTWGLISIFWCALFWPLIFNIPRRRETADGMRHCERHTHTLTARPETSNNNNNREHPYINTRDDSMHWKAYRNRTMVHVYVLHNGNLHNAITDFVPMCVFCCRYIYTSICSHVLAYIVVCCVAFSGHVVDLIWGYDNGACDRRLNVVKLYALRQPIRTSSARGGQ